MPPLAALAIGAVAAEVGAVGIVGGALVSAGIIDATATIAGVALSAIAGGAIVGAGVGAAGAAITGGDPGNGALFGALSGGLTQGIAPHLAGVGGLSTNATNAITSGGVTAALRVAQGQSLGKSLEAGAISGVGSYAGSELQDFINSQTSPSSPTSAPRATSQSAQARGGSSLPQAQTPGVENVFVSANAPSSPSISGAVDAAAPVETKVSPAQRQKDITLANVLNVAGKTAVGAGVQGLSGLIGGSSYYQPNAPTGAAGGVAGAAAAPGSSSSAPGSAAGAATAQAGQAGSSSIYAPGSPIFGDDGSATKRGVWNTASLRTPDAEGA